MRSYKRELLHLALRYLCREALNLSSSSDFELRFVAVSFRHTDDLTDLLQLAKLILDNFRLKRFQKLQMLHIRVCWPADRLPLSVHEPNLALGRISCALLPTKSHSIIRFL